MTLESWADLCRVLTIIGLVVSLIAATGNFFATRALNTQRKETDRKKDEKVAGLEEGIVVIRDFADMAQLNMIGKPYYDGDIVYNSYLSRMLEGTYFIENNKVKFKMDAESNQKHRAVIKKYTRYPFSYYLLGSSLQSKSDPEWSAYLRQAQNILKKTTLISGHNEIHDKVLEELNNTLKNIP